MENNLKQDALNYHAKGRPGKIEVIPSKEYSTQRDLSLAYSPGVAEPCLAIQANPDDAYKYTSKGNLVAVISNGTAVLGLGDIGALAGKPVMEGKGLLFKIYADIDCFDIELNTTDVEEFIRTVKILEPTFGGVNLEDISAPECFEIEERLKKELNIPIMHDDQHGTAIISGAALLNSLELVGKDIAQIKMVVNGAGASAISCAKLYKSLGVAPQNIYMFDSKGLIHPERTNLDGKKPELANATLPKETTLTEAMKGADVFVGLSKGNILNQEMIKGMAKDCVVFALANPTPEIAYDLAMAAREDIIMATGRSDYPNQVNNVLGFPYIFRGDLAKKPVPDMVNMAYEETNLTFGKNYIIPKPVDPRLLMTVAPAVAKAAIETGVAKYKITDWEAYENQLAKRLGNDNSLTRAIMTKAKKNPKRVVFTDAENFTVLKAVQQVMEEGIAFPILLGNKDRINSLVEENGLNYPGPLEIIDPKNPADSIEADRLKQFADILFDKRKRKGLTRPDADNLISKRSYFGAMMVETGMVDSMVSGLTRSYPDTIRPALQIIGPEKGVKKISGMYILMSRFGPLFLADTTINFDPEIEDLVEITELAAKEVERFNIKPRIAMVTYSNFGSVPNGPAPMKLRKAVKILKERNPNIVVDGEMQAHLAFDSELLKENHPFSDLVGAQANTLIFPNLSSANIAYNLLKEVAGIEKIGPILLGLKKPVQILQMGASVREIVNLTAIAVVDSIKR
jgi:malate dehydrogenase (oxaloacetate-decarboxylating)(NADP+)